MAENNEVLGITGKIDIAVILSQLTELSKKLEDVSNATDGTSDKMKKEAAEMKKLVDEAIKPLDKAIGDTTRDTTKLADETGKLSQATSKQDSVMVRMLGGQKNYQTLLSKCPPMMRSFVVELEGMTGAAKAFIATPLGAVLAALVVAYKAVAGAAELANMWLERTVEGNHAARIATARYNQVLNNLKDIGSRVGEVIFNAFNKVTVAIQNAVGWTARLATKLAGVAKWIPGGNLLVAGAVGLDSVVNGRSEDSIKLAERENKLWERKNKFITEEARLEREISEARNRAYDYEISAAERAKAVKEAQEKTNQLFKARIAIAQEEADIIAKRNTLSDSNERDKDEEERAKAQVDRLKAQEANELRMLNRMASRIDRQGASEENKLEQRRKKIEQLNRLLDKQAIDRERRAKDDEMAATEATIAAMEDGSKKTVAMITLNYEKQKEALRRGYEDIRRQKLEEARRIFEADPRNKGKIFDPTSVDTSYTAVETDKYNAQLRANHKAYVDALAANARADKQAWIDYLAEYGTMQEKKLAIAQKYEQAIADIQKSTDSDETKRWKLQALARQRTREEGQLTSASVQQKVNWAALFQGTALMQGVAHSVLAEVGEYMKTSAFSSSSAEDKKAIYEAVASLQAQVSGESGLFGSASAFSQAISNLDQFSRALANAKEQQEFWEEELYKATVAESKTTGEDAEAARMRREIAEKNLQEIDGAVSDYTAKTQEAAQRMQASLQSFHANLNSIVGGISTLAKGSGLSDMFSGTISLLKGFGVKGKSGNGIMDTTGALGKAGGYMSAAFSLADIVNEVGLDGLIDNISNTITGAVTNIVGSVVSGDLFVSLGTSLGNAFMAPFDALFGNGNMEELKKEVEGLKNSNQALQKALSSMEKSFLEATFEDISKTLDELKATHEKIVANNQQMMVDTARMWERGSNSINALFNDGYSDLIQKVNGALGTNFDGLTDMLSEMTPEQWEELLSKDTALFTALTSAIDSLENEHTGQGLSEMIRGMLDLSGKVTEWEEKAKDMYTGVSFESLRDKFKSALKDMENDAKNFADDMTEILNDIVIDSITGKYEDDLKQLRDKMAEAAKNKDWAEFERLRQDYLRLVEQGKAEVQDAKENGYIQDSLTKAEDQSAAAVSADKITYEQADRIDGRLTSMQIIQGQMLEQSLAHTALMTVVQADLSRVSGDVAAVAGNMSTVVELHRQTNEKLDSIVKNTNPIAQIEDYVGRIYRKINDAY